MRYLSIDILRGAAVVLMILTHFVENLSPREMTSSQLYDLTAVVFGVIPAPLFTFVSGLSYYLWLQQQQSRSRTNKEITNLTLRRGLFLFGAGIVFNVLVWLPEDAFNWDILTLIGTSLILLAFARHLPIPVLILICVMVLLLSPPLRIVGDYNAYWQEEASYSYDFTVRDIAFGFIANGFFPLLPWVIFPLAGYIVGVAVFENGSRSALGWIFLTGIGLMTLAPVSILIGAKTLPLIGKHYANGFTMFPASTEYVAGMLGLSMAAFVLLFCLIDRRSCSTDTGLFLKFLQRFGAYSLTIYILHHIVHLWPLWLYGIWNGQDSPTYYWRRAMSTSAAIALALLFIVLCYFVVIFLETHKRYTFESLMRRTCGQ